MSAHHEERFIFNGIVAQTDILVYSLLTYNNKTNKIKRKP